MIEILLDEEPRASNPKKPRFGYSQAAQDTYRRSFRRNMRITELQAHCDKFTEIHQT